MMPIFIIIFFIACLLAGVWFLRRRPLRQSVLLMLHSVSQGMPLADAVFKKYPIPTVSGHYFGYRMALEGSIKKDRPHKERGFRFLATVELPKPLEGRIFLQHESRKTSLKPIAGLKLVKTGVARFDEHFLLLSGSERLARAAFQPYLCEKMMALPILSWQVDAHGKEAHFEIWQAMSDAQTLPVFFRTAVEMLNSLVVAGGV